MHGMLNISEAANLGLHAGMMLARSRGKPVPARTMAETLGVSYHHLAKVLNRLEKAGLARSLRGPGGGYTLARKASQVRLMDVYEAMDGPFPTQACLFGHPACPRGDCIMGDVLVTLNAGVRRRLETTRLSAFSERKAQ